METITSQSSLAHSAEGGHGQNINVGSNERMISLLGGGVLALAGLASGRKSGIGLAILGTGLLYRGATGHCSMYQALGINSAEPHASRASLNEGIKVEKSLTIQNKSPEELFQFWRNLENLAQFMEHVESIHKIDDKRSHWVVKGPAGRHVEWDAEIINERENELIAWRTVEDAEVAHAGSVRFEKGPNGQGTVVRVSLLYSPPAGKLGAAIAKLFGEEPHIQVQQDLRRFKMLMESGEIATTKGQPHGNSPIRPFSGREA